MFKVIWNIVKQIFSLILWLLSPLKRLICRRKRKNSDTILPLTSHYPSVEGLSSMNGTSEMAADVEMEPWDNWEGGDQSSKQQTQSRNYQQYRQQQQQQQEEEPEPDYFQSMAPVYKKQTKVLVKKKDDHINPSAISNKLAVASDPPFIQTSELGTWEDQSQTWEDEAGEDLSWEADNAIKEKRKAERQQRQLQQQRKKQERENYRNKPAQGQFSAVRLS